MRTALRFVSWAFLLSFVAMMATARADEIFSVSLSTEPLTVIPGSTAGPFSLAFQLVQGSQAGQNTATIDDFNFGSGGSAGLGCPAAFGGVCTFGDASGDIVGSVLLGATQPFDALVETFTPGTSLFFQVDLTTNVDTGGIPDAFAFSILDSGGGSIPTLDPSGADTLLTVNIDSANPSIAAYGTDPSRLTNGGTGVSLTLGAPAIGAPVPEPSTLAMFGIGLFFSLAGAVQCRTSRQRFLEIRGQPAPVPESAPVPEHETSESAQPEAVTEAPVAPPLGVRLVAVGEPSESGSAHDTGLLVQLVLVLHWPLSMSST